MQKGRSWCSGPWQRHPKRSHGGCHRSHTQLATKHLDIAGTSAGRLSRAIAAVEVAAA
jgi:hypothetical protein